MEHTKMAAKEYSKMAGGATTHGLEFEWSLAGLLHLRGLNSEVDFQIGTNVKGAGALDDIVFRFREDGTTWRTLYVQLKHKERKWLSRSMLLKPNEAFSLSKYFKSYLEIKEAMSTETKEPLFEGSLESCLFVLFTNTKGNKDLGEIMEEDFSQAEEFLWSGTGSVFSLETDEEMLGCLGDCGEDGRKFLKQLRVFCGQPSGKQLKAAVKEELIELGVAKTQHLNIGRLCECYLDNVKVWWERQGAKNDILHRGHNILESAMDKLRLESCSEQTLNDYNLELSFEDAALLELRHLLINVKTPVAQVESSKAQVKPSAGQVKPSVGQVKTRESSCHLTFTKLWQASEGQWLVVKLEHLTALRRALLEEGINGLSTGLLILCADKGCPSEDGSDEYFRVISEIFQGRDTFSVVFLSDENNSQVSELTARFPGGCTRYSDNFNFSQLREVSRNYILARVVTLQGHDTTLGELLSKDGDSLDQVLKASFLVDILGREGPLTIGSALPEGIDYYTERTLEQALCVKSSVFQALRGNVTVRITQSKPSIRGLLKKALEFVLVSEDIPFCSHGDMKDMINKLVVTPLLPDVNDHQVFIGPECSVGSYQFSCVGLRLGEENPVTALRVRPGTSEGVAFLFACLETHDDDVSKLGDFHRSRHWFSLKDGRLRWIQSHSDIESIRKHIDEDQVSRFAPETAMDVEDRLVLVCAEPGMGKSTLMARLAKNTKAALPHYFVITIAINDHTRLFAEGKHKDVLEFLSIAAKMDSPMQRSLLKFALEVSGNVVVIVDGFDEIAPRYVKECCHLLSRLLEETKARKIWMTSRNSVKQTIEAHFSQFSAKLREFDQEDQKIFFRTFWDKKSILSDIELDIFIDDLLEKSSKAIHEQEKNFLGIPLQCQMLAEVFADHVSGSGKGLKLPDRLDLFSLLEMFVDKKSEVYVENKMRMESANTIYENQCRKEKIQFIDSHSKAGLVLILGEDELKSLGMEQILKDSSAFCNEIQLGEDKTGFVDEIVNDKPRFIHRVFAEYFVAKWISQHLADSAELIESKMFTEDFAVIRHIFNGILCNGSALHSAVLQENEAEVRALLQSEDVEAQDVGGRTALHLAAGFGTSEDQEENTRRGKILDLIIGKTSDFQVVDKIMCGSPLRYADIARTWVAIDKLLCKADDVADLRLTLGNVADDDMLDTIVEQDLDKLLGLCLDHGLAVEHRTSDDRLLVTACEEGSFKVASLLIERNADINDNDDAPLVAASTYGHLEIVKLLHKKLVSEAKESPCEEPGHGTSQDPFKGINKANREGCTALHHAARKGHTEVLRFLISQGGDPQNRDKNNRTPLHLATWFDHPNAVRVLLEAVEVTSVPEYIDLRDDYEGTALYFAAVAGSVECIKLLLQTGTKLSQVGLNGETLLIAAARKGNQEVVEWLLENFDSDREDMTLQEYIAKRDNNGNNALYFAALEGSIKSVELVHQSGGKLCTFNEHGLTPLMKAAKTGKQEVVQWLLENFKAEREGMTLQAYIDLRLSCGNSVMNLSASGGSVECLEHMFHAGGKLALSGCKGKTLLMEAAMKAKHEVLLWLLDNFNVDREGMTLQEYMDMKDKNGNTAMHLAAAGGSVEFITLLQQAGGKLNQLGLNGRTLLMMAAMNGKQEVVEWLLKNFNLEINGMTLQEYIDTKDMDGDTAMTLAVFGGSVDCIHLLQRAGGKLCQVGSNGRTMLMFSAARCNQKVLEWLLKKFNSEREGMALQEYLNMKDKDGDCILHYAVNGGSVDCIKLVLEAGGKFCVAGVKGHTPIMRSAIEGKHQVMKWALDNFNPDQEGMTLQEYVDIKDEDGETLPHYAASGGSVECVELLYQAGVNLCQVGLKGQTPLMTAAKEGKQEVVEWILANFNGMREGITLQEYVNMKDKDGDTAIYYATSNGYVECLSALVESGGNLCHVGSNGRTFLMLAAMKGKLEVVKWLLDNFNSGREGMKLQEYIDMKDNSANTAMHRAVVGGSLECLKHLVHAGAKLTQPGFIGQTPLMIAALEGKHEMLEWILGNFNAEREGMTLQEYIYIKDKDRDTVMYYTASKRSVECYNALVGVGGKLCRVGLNGKTLLMKFAEKGKHGVVKWLLDNFEADREGMTLQEYIDMKDKDGDSVFYYATLAGSIDCLQLVLEAGGKLSQLRWNGETLLMSASKEGKQQVVQWLLENFIADREGMTLEEFINMKDKQGRTALFYVLFELHVVISNISEES